MKHLDRYLAEFTYRFNNREEENLFALVIAGLLIKSVLPYAELIAKEPPATTIPDEEPF